MATTNRSYSPALVETDLALRQRDRLWAAIARLGGHCDWQVDSAGWVVTLHLPRERTFAGSTLEAALEACLAWLTPDPAPNSPSGARDSLAPDPAVANRAFA